ncbi:MAG: PKD domain-containing protein, partial [Bacteroidetes bacterium]
GFRNPYRFIVKPESGSHNPADGDPGTILVSDVGSAGWEELNVVERGGECFGWPMFEGINFNWGFLNNPTENPDAPNDLDCGGDYFTFNDLIQQPLEDQDPIFTHPCDNSRLLPAAIQRFVHKPPTLAWSGLLWNPPPKTRVPVFRPDDGKLVEVDLDQEGSPIPGTEAFAGFTGVPGFFYDGSGPLPEEYDGAFFQADLSGWLRVLRFNEAMEVTDVQPFATWEERGIVHVTYNPHDGAIYWLHIYDSQVFKISYGGNPRPKAIATADQQYGPGPLTVQFSAAQSFDPDNTPLSYHWDFGDGNTSELECPSHTFLANGQAIKSYTVTLTVTDALGASDEETLLISLNNTPPQVSISSIAPNERYPLNGLTYLPLKAQVTDAEHHEEELTYRWQTFLHHNNHFHANAAVADVESEMVIDPLGCELETYWYRVRLTVTDAEGLSNFDEREIFPNCDDPFFAITDLKASLDNQEVQLDWTVEFDDGVQWFEIQRSGNYTFLPIDQVDASAIFTYTYLDRNPEQGPNYYRIKGVNANGDYHYSNVVFVDATDKSTIKAYPNPVQEMLTIHIPEARAEQVKFEIISPAGYIVFSTIWPASPGLLLQRELTLEGLPNGFYYYRIRNGEQERTASFILLR